MTARDLAKYAARIDAELTADVIGIAHDGCAVHVATVIEETKTILVNRGFRSLCTEDLRDRFASHDWSGVWCFADEVL